MRSCKSLKGGLQDIADDLQLERIGTQHQAGSDSLLTCLAFFKIRHLFFDDHIDDTRHQGLLFGLGSAVETAGRPVTSGQGNNPFMTGVFGGSDQSALFGTTPPLVQ